MPELQGIARRTVDQAMQERFAAVSGDRNPMHMDALAARRTQAGLPVVHGVHTMLWALESLAANGQLTEAPVRVRCGLLKWVYLGDETTVRVAEDRMVNPAALQVDVLGLVVLTAQLAYGPGVRPAEERPLAASPGAPLGVALDLSFADLEGRSGVAYTAEAGAVGALFPRLVEVLGAAAVAEIMACSYIVGMEAPGLHSMFSKLDVTLHAACGEDMERAGLGFAVSYLDERFRKGRIEVTGRGIAGRLDVFIRNPPVQQASVEALKTQVEALEFAGMRALVVGGSRGLGELSAKLIAAGGGAPTVTYAVGKAEAEAVAEQIHAAGETASVMPYDVLQPPGPQLAGVEQPFTHLLYFATNTIFRPKSALVSPASLAAFTSFYLQGFYNLCVELTRPGARTTLAGGKLIVCYPSSVFVEERPAGMTEYAMVKAAGEQMCRDMNQYLPGLQIVASRLPKLVTDQTAGVLPGRDADPVAVLLPILWTMRDLARQE